MIDTTDPRIAAIVGDSWNHETIAAAKSIDAELTALCEAVEAADALAAWVVADSLADTEDSEAYLRAKAYVERRAAHDNAERIIESKEGAE